MSMPLIGSGSPPPPSGGGGGFNSRFRMRRIVNFLIQEEVLLAILILVVGILGICFGGGCLIRSLDTGSNSLAVGSTASNEKEKSDSCSIV